VIHTNMKL